MKVNILDAHDRLKVFNKQADYISRGCLECIKNRPEEFLNHPFYIFAHARTEDDGVTKRLIWQPRLSKPSPQTNSMLFKAYPPTDNIKIIWMIPARELWDNYKKGNLTENKVITESIKDFVNDRAKLAAREPDDLLEFQISDIYDEISRNANLRKTIKLMTSEESSISSE